MGWPYHLVDLTHDEKHQRRLTLDRYGVYSQLSALIPVIAYQLYRICVWVYSERQRARVRYSAVPGSPGVKHDRASTASSLVRKWRSTVWWLEGEIAPNWGLRIHWVAGGSWMVWLLFLCVNETGEGKLVSRDIFQFRSNSIQSHVPDPILGLFSYFKPTRSFISAH